MRSLRLILYFALGVVLGGVVTIAHAETQAATYGYQLVPPTYDFAGISGSCNPTYMGPFTTVDEGCSALLGQAKSLCPTNTLITKAELTASSGMTCNSTESWSRTLTRRCPTGFSYNTTSGACKSASQINYCPDSTWTLEGSTCTRVNPCPASGTGTGTNEDKVSPAFPNLYGWYDPAATTTKGGSGSYCSSGCTVAFQATVCVQSTQPGTNNCAALNTTYTGSTCTGTTAPIVAGTTAKPPCAQGEGVVTMGGKVACVPTGASTDIPKVSKSSSTQTFPDGSTKITNTTTTCSGVGACSTTTTVTNTTATSGANAGGAGQAGTPGTTTDEEDSVGDDETSFCAKNPDLQMCKGGIAEEGTQKQVLDEVKKLTSVDANTDKTAITNASKYTETPGYQAAKDADDNLVKYAAGVTKNAEVEASKTTFEQALSSGFWTDIPTASCSTPTYTIAGHEIEWDRWCEIVGMIQEIGAYGMWVMLAISIFVMLSGGRQT